jgi:hypothetical protein
LEPKPEGRKTLRRLRRRRGNKIKMEIILKLIFKE